MGADHMQCDVQPIEVVTPDKEDTMYKTFNVLPEKIRSKSVAALLAGLVALTALSMTPLTASAGSLTPLTASTGTTDGAGVTGGEIRHVVVKYLTEHPELLRQAAPAPHGIYAAPVGIYVGDSEHQKP